jgi:hypothetical protein
VRNGPPQLAVTLPLLSCEYFAVLVVSGGCFAAMLPDVHLVSSWWILCHRNFTTCVGNLAFVFLFLLQVQLVRFETEGPSPAFLVGRVVL